MRKLTLALAAKVKTPGLHRDKGEGAARGLYLQIRPLARGNGFAASWLYRYAAPATGKLRWMGLGPLDCVTHADAREMARTARAGVKRGHDPIETRRAERARLRADQAKAITFKVAAEKYIAAHEAGWRNEKHRQQWKASLETYAFPILGKQPVASVDTALVLKVLEPIWSVKAETAGRLQQRIARVLDWAKARGYRVGDNPARWTAHLEALLPARRTGKSAKHHPALPYAEIPAFMSDLRQHQGQSARALELLILTVLRTGELIGGKLTEIDLEAKVWTVPAERMKAGREHRVPLSDRAIEILKALPREKDNPYIFIGGRAGGHLSNMAMLAFMKHFRPEYVPHGFRSTFKDWVSETTNHPGIVSEMALAHTIPNRVEAAYRRGDLFEKRRRLMRDWERYCAKPATSASVTPLRRAS